MTAINGLAELLLRALPESAPERRYAVEFVDAGDRAASLTRQLLAFSRRLVLRPRVLDLNAVIREGIGILRRVIGEDIDLVTALASAVGPVRADLVQIQQVILNLTVNARDAMPDGGNLTLETADVVVDEAFSRRRPDVRPGPYVMLAVRDTGCGMDPEILSLIFEPFFTTKEEGKGTGLGLATVYGIVRQSGGFLEVESTPGWGSTFRVYLPRASEPLSVAPPEAAEPEGLRDWEDARAEILGDPAARRRDGPVEVRICDPEEFSGEPKSPRQAVWLRPRGAIPDDPLLHAAVLVYASDRTLINTAARLHGLPWGRRRSRTRSSARRACASP